VDENTMGSLLTERIARLWRREEERMAAKNEPQKVVTACPDCGQSIALKGKTEPGRRFTCIHCGAELKVVKANPLKLGMAYGA
jgi:lysine biosynthesis protein LysW